MDWGGNSLFSEEVCKIMEKFPDEERVVETRNLLERKVLSSRDSLWGTKFLHGGRRKSVNSRTRWNRRKESSQVKGQRVDERRGPLKFDINQNIEEGVEDSQES